MAKTKAQLDAQGHTGPIYDVGVPVPARRSLTKPTKGHPFGNCKVIDVKVYGKGIPSLFILKHPTSKSPGQFRRVTATPEIIRTFFPGAMDVQVSTLMGY